MSDWKQKLVDDAEAALGHAIVEESVAEYVFNMKGNFGVDLSEGLPKFGLVKVMAAAAVVARAQALGIDPDLIRLSNEEANEQIIELARRAAEAGKPVFVIEAEEER